MAFLPDVRGHRIANGDEPANLDTLRVFSLSIPSIFSAADAQQAQDHVASLRASGVEIDPTRPVYIYRRDYGGMIVYDGTSFKTMVAQAYIASVFQVDTRWNMRASEINAVQTGRTITLNFKVKILAAINMKPWEKWPLATYHNDFSPMTQVRVSLPYQPSVAVAASSGEIYAVSSQNLSLGVGEYAVAMTWVTARSNY